ATSVGNPPTIKVTNQGDCGFHIGNIFSSGAVGVCVASQARDKIASSMNGIAAAAGTTISQALKVPMPTNLQDIALQTACPEFQECSTAADCASGAAGQGLTGLFDGSSNLGLTAVPKAKVGLDLNAYGFIGGLGADRTVAGLNADGT